MTDLLMKGCYNLHNVVTNAFSQYVTFRVELRWRVDVLKRTLWQGNLQNHRHLARFGACFGLALALAGCSATSGLMGQPTEKLAAPTIPVQSSPLAAPQGSLNQLGSGPVRVGLILPLTQAGGPSVVGASLRNAAELAISESGGTDITLLIKDDGSSAQGAAAATQAALNEGAELILGPLIAGDVRASAQVARAAGRPEIAFSTDKTVASQGVYLLSFLVESDVDRVVDYAAAHGKTSFAALIPDNQYGNVAAAEFQERAAARGIRIQTLERYTPATLSSAVAKVAQIKDQINGLFLPEQADAVGNVARLLTQSGVDTRKVQIVGTGLWNDARVMSSPAMQGAWFAAPDNSGFNDFAQRYRARFHSDPTRIATLTYDAVTLAAALARTQGAQRYSEAVLTNGAGFNGADGVFRFRPNGMNERGLAVLQISNGSARTISPAPRSFNAQSASR